MSTYRSDSDIERFNALPANHCQVMPASVLRELVRVGEQLSVQSAGALRFDRGAAARTSGDSARRPVRKKSPLPRRWPRRANVSVTIICASTATGCARTPPSKSTSTASPPGMRWTPLPRSSRPWASATTSPKPRASSRRPAENPTARHGALPWRSRGTINRWPSASSVVDGYGLSTSGDYRNYFVAGRAAFFPHPRCPHRVRRSHTTWRQSR